MSVSSKEYVLIGYDLSTVIKKMNEDELDEWLERMEQGVPSNVYEFIFDGMSGEYCFIGFVLNKSSKYDGMPIKKYWIDDLDLIKEDVYEALKDLNITIQNPALYSFTHWY